MAARENRRLLDKVRPALRSRPIGPIGPISDHFGPIGPNSDKVDLNGPIRPIVLA